MPSLAEGLSKNSETLSTSNLRENKNHTPDVDDSRSRKNSVARRARRATYSGERLVKYLTNAGAWYYSRYAPSVAKLRAWLGRRANGDTLVLESVLTTLSPLFCEETILDARIRGFLDRSKSQRFVENKLRVAGFLLEDIRRVLRSHQDDFLSWETYAPAARRKIKSLMSRGKTARESMTALRTAFPGFPDEVEALVDESYTGHNEELDLAEALGAAIRKFGADTRQKCAKIFRKLVARGFSVDKVRRALGEVE